jgi:hypothetical protein
MKKLILFIAMLSTSVISNGQTDEQLMERAYGFFGQDDFKATIETCDQVIGIDSTNFEAYELKANSKKKTKRF